MFEPKNYQRTTLDWLRQYLEEARYSSPQTAFETIRQKNPQTEKTPYRPLNGLENIPYVCLRLPTGGGKTYLAARAIALASRAYLEQDFPLVLWLVPTNTIRQQTIDTLYNPSHANRKAIEAIFGNNITVVDIADFNQIRPHDLKSKVVIVVGTMQTLRVNSTEGRKVYDHHEDLEPHFVNVPRNTPDLERFDEGSQVGAIKFSFRNLLALHRPLVIVDEAHNASSELSVEVMQRVRPACILEFTATPAANSNILHAVSALELKAEEMIKLPIVLTRHQTWQQAIESAVETRQIIHNIARLDRDFIHPILLIQAEDKSREVTFDIIRQYLIEQCKINPESIAIATGSQRGLDGINLLDPGNKIDIVITVEALKEGWDCPFAYVFCSVAAVHSKKDVEQLLGRVLRMPYAKKREKQELNKAYAHVSASSWPHAISQLQDRLVNMGFEEQVAEEAILPLPPGLPGIDLISLSSLSENPICIGLSAAPKMDYFTLDEQERIRVQAGHEGRVEMQISGPVGPIFETKLIQAVPSEDREELKRTLSIYRRHLPHSPAQLGNPFIIPQLCLWVDGQLELAADEWFLDSAGLNLLDYPAELVPDDFNIREEAESYSIDINGRKLSTKFLGVQTAFDFDGVETGWSDLSLTRWFDNKLYQRDIRQEVLFEWLRRNVDFLIKRREFSLSQLVRWRFLLEKAFLEKIKSIRVAVYQRGYQHRLFDTSAKVETSQSFAFTFDPNIYPARSPYVGRYQFSKHYYTIIGELESAGEEFECAQAIDRCQSIKHWVRNLAMQPFFSFHLPLANGLFYPDFVCELNDGRLLVVEYKGAHLIEYEKEKQNIGELWAEKSQGKGLFLWAVKEDQRRRDVYMQLEDMIR